MLPSAPHCTTPLPIAIAALCPSPPLPQPTHTQVSSAARSLRRQVEQRALSSLDQLEALRRIAMGGGAAGGSPSATPRALSLRERQPSISGSVASGGYDGGGGEVYEYTPSRVSVGGGAPGRGLWGNQGFEGLAEQRWMEEKRELTKTLQPRDCLRVDGSCSTDGVGCQHWQCSGFVWDWVGFACYSCCTACCLCLH
jgi:hypothetical protein